MPNKDLLIIDGHNFLFRSYYGVPRGAMIDNIAIHGIYGFFSLLRKTIEYTKATDLFIVFDSESGINEKVNQIKDYKSNRLYDEEAFKQLMYIKRILNILKIPWLEREDYEADDVIASAVKQLQTSFSNIVIASTDSDFLQLLNKKRYLMRGKLKLFGLEDFYNYFGFPPEYYVDYLSLKGDKSDNIDGIQGIGHKRASILIQNFKTLEKVFDNLDLLDIYSRKRLNGKQSYLLHIRDFLKMNSCIHNIDFQLFISPLSKNIIPKQMGNFLKENKNKVF